MVPGIDKPVNHVLSPCIHIVVGYGDGQFLIHFRRGRVCSLEFPRGVSFLRDYFPMGLVVAVRDEFHRQAGVAERQFGVQPQGLLYGAEAPEVVRGNSL